LGQWSPSGRFSLIFVHAVGHPAAQSQRRHHVERRRRREPVISPIPTRVVTHPRRRRRGDAGERRGDTRGEALGGSKTRVGARGRPAETAAPSPPPAPRIDENDRERWWEEDEDAENQAGSKDDDDDATELAASFQTSVSVKTVTAASSGRREMPTRRPRLALPPPSLPTGKPRTNPHQIGVSTHAKHKAKAAVKASASSTHAGVPKTLGMAMCS
jgi:hypothetical protein